MNNDCHHPRHMKKLYILKRCQPILLHSKDKLVTEGKTTVRSIAKVIQKKKRLDSPILIAGFPGPGLVGSISTSYIINRLHMEQIACVESEFIRTRGYLC